MTLALLVWAICGTALAGYYATQYTTYRGEYSNLLSDLSSISLRVNIFVSYGNGTRTWFNNTALPVGSTAFTALRLLIPDVGFKDYGESGGILVTSINGLAQNSTHGWFYWCKPVETSKWISPNYSCSQYILHLGDTIAFTYQSYNPWPTSPLINSTR